MPSVILYYNTLPSLTVDRNPKTVFGILEAKVSIRTLLITSI